MKQKINNRKINEDGVVVLNDDALFESLFIDPTAINIVIAEKSDSVNVYNKWAKIYDLPNIKSEHQIDHKKNQTIWFMPDSYKNLDIERYLLDRCKSEEQIERASLELSMFKERDLYDLLRYMVYLVDTMRQNKIVWGVGRGSSVSSYVLYLIGVHKVDSILYKLDISEFLK